jgi:hypothetical protein
VCRWISTWRFYKRAAAKGFAGAVAMVPKVEAHLAQDTSTGPAQEVD